MGNQCSITGLRQCAVIFSPLPKTVQVVNDREQPKAPHRDITIPLNLFIPDLTSGAVDEKGRPTKGLTILLCADQESVCELLEKGEKISVFHRPRVLVDQTDMRWNDDDTPSPLMREEIFSFAITSEQLRAIVFHRNPAVMLTQTVRSVLEAKHAFVMIDEQRAEQDRRISLINRLHGSDVISLDCARKSEREEALRYQEEPLRDAISAIRTAKKPPKVHRTLTLHL